jgi:hypothetical protein
MARLWPGLCSKVDAMSATAGCPFMLGSSAFTSWSVTLAYELHEHCDGGGCKRSWCCGATARSAPPPSGRRFFHLTDNLRFIPDSGNVVLYLQTELMPHLSNPPISKGPDAVGRYGSAKAARCL